MPSPSLPPSTYPPALDTPSQPKPSVSSPEEDLGLGAARAPGGVGQRVRERAVLEPCSWESRLSRGPGLEVAAKVTCQAAGRGHQRPGSRGVTGISRRGGSPLPKSARVLGHLGLEKGGSLFPHWPRSTAHSLALAGRPVPGSTSCSRPLGWAVPGMGSWGLTRGHPVATWGTDKAPWRSRRANILRGWQRLLLREAGLQQEPGLVAVLGWLGPAPCLVGSRCCLCGSCQALLAVGGAWEVLVKPWAGWVWLLL